MSEKRFDPRSGGRTEVDSPAVRAVLTYVLTPDPLDLLIQQALGLPDEEPVRWAI
jgi:hypothetical protein